MNNIETNVIKDYLIPIFSPIIAVGLFTFSYFFNKRQEKHKYIKGLFLELKVLYDIFQMNAILNDKGKIVSKERFELQKEKAKAFFSKMYTNPNILDKVVDSKALKPSKKMSLLLAEVESRLNESISFSEKSQYSYVVFGLTFLLYLFSYNKSDTEEWLRIIEEVKNMNMILYQSYFD